MKTDTIAAIITALGVSAINVIRVSGENAISVVNSVYKGKNLEKVSSHTVNYGYIFDGNEQIDEVLVSVFYPPKSFTTELTVEISTHGGSYIANKILELLLTKGCRLAEPGEFTKRAFLNGRIDLTQAEAVMDMIESSNKTSLRLANKALRGDIYNLVKTLRDEVLNIIAQIEVNIDYPEYEDVETITNEIVMPKVIQLMEKLDFIIEKAQDARVFKDGIKTAIIGKPNVGKSSLLNTLLHEEKAIVTDISGTTRDTVEGEIRLAGIPLKLIDTAGIRQTTDYVEKIGIEKAKKALEESELVILMLDASKELTTSDYELLELTKNKKRIIVGNKIDLGKANIDTEIIPMSLVTKKGITELESKIKMMFIKNELSYEQDLIIANTRHISLLEKTKACLQDVVSGINKHEYVDMIEIDLKNAWFTLGEITGETNKDELISELFSKFCLGK